MSYITYNAPTCTKAKLLAACQMTESEFDLLSSADPVAVEQVRRAVCTRHGLDPEWYGPLPEALAFVGVLTEEQVDGWYHLLGYR